MIAVDIFLVVVVFGIIGLIVYSVNNRATVTAKTRPNVELAHAVRIMDRILAADQVLPTLPHDLLEEAAGFVRTYYKEMDTK